MFGKKNISDRLKDLFEKEIHIREILAKFDAEVDILHSTIPEVDDFEQYTEKNLALDKQREVAKNSLKLISIKRIDLLKESYETDRILHEKNVKRAGEESAKAEATWVEAQKKADELKAQYRQASIKHQTLAESTPLAFHAKPWSLKSLKEKLDSEDCPVRDRAELRAAIQRYEVAERQGRNYPFPHFYINEDGEIAKFEGDPKSN